MPLPSLFSVLVLGCVLSLLLGRHNHRRRRCGNDPALGRLRLLSVALGAPVEVVDEHIVMLHQHAELFVTELLAQAGFRWLASHPRKQLSVQLHLVDARAALSRGWLGTTVASFDPPPLCRTLARTGGTASTESGCHAEEHSASSLPPSCP